MKHFRPTDNTAWHTSPDAIAIIAGMDRPDTGLVRNELGDANDTHRCYVGEAVDALEAVFVRWMQAHPNAIRLVLPTDVLSALFGPADPSRVFADDWTRWARIADEVRAVLDAQEAAFAAYEKARGNVLACTPVRGEAA